MQVESRLKMARISPQKARLVADQIRGMKVESALEVLTFSEQKAGEIMKKLVDSAIANAEHNEGADIDELRVSEVQVNEGADDEAASRTGQGAGQPHPQAHQPHHRHRLGFLGAERMGQKVHPIGIRLGISQDWNSTWYADTEDYANYLNDDIRIREFLKKQLSHASVSRIQIQRPAKAVIITIHSARPGIVIGKKGEDVERLRRARSRRCSASASTTSRSTSPRSGSPSSTRSWSPKASPSSSSAASCSAAP